jgi:hypothetical protein
MRRQRQNREKCCFGFNFGGASCGARAHTTAAIAIVQAKIFSKQNAAVGVRFLLIFSFPFRGMAKANSWLMVGKSIAPRRWEAGLDRGGFFLLPSPALKPKVRAGFGAPARFAPVPLQRSYPPCPSSPMPFCA